MGLGIREARRDLSGLVKRVAYAGEEVVIGSHGHDEATLISTGELRRLRRELEQARQLLRRLEGAEVGSGPRAAAPFSGLQAALEAGALGTASAARPPRRRMPELRTESGISREEQARIGARGSAGPRLRRREPRA